MRTSVAVVLAAVALLLALPTSGHARPWHGHGDWHGHGEVFVGVGPPWWDPTYPGWYYPPPAYMVTPPPVIIRDEPQEYVERESDEPDEPARYWYYCPTSHAYYPDVRKCSEPWTKVPPRD